MNKTKYVVIFTLLLAFGLMFKQLIDYKDIANRLLIEINDLDNQTRLLKEQIEDQSKRILQLEQYHIEKEEFSNSPYGEIINNEENNETNTTEDSNQTFYENNETNQTYQEINTTQESYSQPQELNETTPTYPEENETQQEITSENAITGYGLEHMR
jgi:hypothetical protein